MFVTSAVRQLFKIKTMYLYLYLDIMRYLKHMHDNAEREILLKPELLFMNGSWYNFFDLYQIFYN